MTTYVVYFKWLDDGMEDSFNCEGYNDLKLNLENMKKRGEHTLLGLCKISKYGEYMKMDIPKKYQF